ncbi:DUF86 domain-containing protein [Roseomonas sp. CCTCC AB2023176]|uniref:HepT-like ribonuclease domain-containing protein n=1 Tax=Roseomonas sp. CCTCC AB2023176 TaxID=3342640 RepID=UPI0035DB428B
MDYEADELLRSAIERKLMIVGEALADLRRRRPDVAARITAIRDVIAFRNILGYGVVEDDRVWDIVQRFLPAPEQELEVILGDRDLD